jgi:hypothetical protein
MKLISGISLIVFAIFLFIICPIALIGAINTLFNFHIQYTVETWFASAMLYYSFARPGRFINVKTKTTK